MIGIIARIKKFVEGPPVEPTKVRWRESHAKKLDNGLIQFEIPMNKNMCFIIWFKNDVEFNEFKNVIGEVVVL